MSETFANGRTSRTVLSVWHFLVLSFVLCIPLWVVGENKLPLPVNLPTSALTAFVPMIAAAVLSYKDGGIRAIKELFGRTLDFHKIRGLWWLLILLPPLIYILAYLVMQGVGRPLPEQIEFPLAAIPAFFVMYFVSAMGEEVGWTAYATDPLLARWDALRASVLLGIGWTIWHSIAFLQTGHPIDWVVWQCFKTIALRMLIVWVYNGTSGSVFAAILFHMMDNISWSLFPNYGSHYDPSITNGMTWLVVCAVIAAGGFQALMLRSITKNRDFLQ
jgi:uncharacterized protein